MTSFRLSREALAFRLTWMTARQVFFEGHVQGVGFRWSVKRIATGYDVTGWVRNLPDGRVEMHVMGEKSEVEGFIEGVQESELRANIRRTEVSNGDLRSGAKGFEIRP